MTFLHFMELHLNLFCSQQQKKIMKKIFFQNQQFQTLALTQYPGESVSLFLNSNQHHYPTLEDTNQEQSNLWIAQTQLNYSEVFRQFQNWHFFQFEYGIESQPYLIYIEVFLYNVSFPINTTHSGKLMTNSIYNIFIGGSDYSKLLLFAQIYDMKFQYNYNDNKPKIHYECHFTCLDCNGPFERDCTSCSSELNRVFVVDEQKCQCKVGYFEVGILACQKMSDYYSSLIVNEKQLQISKVDNCRFGYFKLPTNQNQCWECPQQSISNALCLDCILNPDDWFNEPICTFDFISQDVNNAMPYSNQHRKQLDYDVYFISNEGYLTLKPELLAFCKDQNTQDCFQSNSKHLNIIPFVKCKPNYQYFDGQCKFKNPLCLIVNQFGDCEETIDGMYYFEGAYFLCPIQCKKCYFDQTKNTVQCLSCQGDLVNINGNCHQCGQFCKMCQIYFDKILQFSYLKCYKCIDDRKYYLSFDGVNCKKNLIDQCIHAFEVDKNDWSKNTLDLYFIPRNDQENIVVHCGRCETSLYILNKQKCLQGWFANYLYLYAMDLCDVQLTVESASVLEFNSIITKIFGFDKGEKNIGIEKNFSLVCTTKQFLLFQNSQIDEIFKNLPAIQFSDGCEFYNEHCSLCLQGRTNDTFTCLECKRGYYVEKVSEKCQKCPIELNCLACVQQNKLFQDEWKNEIRMVYKVFIEEQSQNHLFIQYGQSQIIDDYEIVCTSCLSEYYLFQNICIKPCPNSCLECQVQNGENICIKCKETLMGRPMTVIKNECIQCSLNCLICVERTVESFQIVNPLFSNFQYQQNSFPCIKSLQDKNYYFDEEVQIFVDCLNYVNCQKEISIQINLICSKDQYIQQISSIQNQQEQEQFFLNNIFIDDLISDSSFKQYENDYFYYIANQQLVKVIKITITSQQEQSCFISENGKIQQKFSQNIFTAIHVQLSLNFLYPTEFIFTKNLIFSNFESIEISGLTLRVRESENEKLISFTSIFQSQLSLKNITCLTEGHKQNNFKIQISNAKQIEIRNLKIFGIRLNDQNFFLQIFNNFGSQAIKIINITILESYFFNSKIIMIKLKQDDKILMEEVNIHSVFENSPFLVLEEDPYSGIVEINDARFTLQLKDTSSFINLQTCKFLKFNTVSFFSSIIQNSTIVLLNNATQLISIYLFHNNLQKYSNIFMAKNNNSDQTFFNFYVLENQYDQSSVFLKIIKVQNQITKVNFNNFTINSNYLTTQSKDFNYKLKTASLFYVEVDYLIMNQIQIERGYGLSEFSIANCYNLTIQSLYISQGENFKFRGMHEFLFCQLQFVLSVDYRESIRIYAAQNIILSNITINFSNTYNSPIILINSENILFSKKQETIYIYDLKAINNLLLLTTVDSPASLIFIKSKQEISLTLMNLEFQNNIMLQYLQDQKFQSALILFIECFQGKVKIINSNFKGNILFNSTDSLNYINVNEIMINNCTFIKNNIFNFTSLQPHLLWKFDNSKKYYQEDFQNIFPIYSTTGNGFIIAQFIKILNSEISESQGSNGGAFLLSSQKQGRIEIKNTSFYGLKNLFKNILETGGCLSIDAKQSESLNILIIDIQVNQISSRQNGGFLFISVGNNQIIVNIQNITIQDTYSQQGSIVFVSSPNNAKQIFSFFIQNIRIQCSILGIIQYFDQYFTTKISSEEQLRLTTKMSLFFIQNAQGINFYNITADSIFNQAFLIGVNIVKTQIYSLVIQQSNLKNLLIAISPDLRTKNKIIMNQILVQDVQFQQNSFQFHCPLSSIIPQEFSQHFQCPHKSEINLKTNIEFISNRQNENFTYGCLFFQKAQEFKSFSESLFSLNPLDTSTTIKVINFTLNNINCSLCQNGLLYLYFIKQTSTIVHLINFQIINSFCGVQGCINLQKVLTNQNSNLSNFDSSRVNFEIFISNYVCLNNTSNFGVCVFINNLASYLENSYFKNNSAKNLGGSVFFKNTQYLIMRKTTITNNKAQAGGGIFLDEALSMNYQEFQTYISHNSASEYGNDIASIPEFLTIAFGDSVNELQTKRIFSNNLETVDLIVLHQGLDIVKQKENYLQLPTGQQLSKYKIFDFKTQTYKSYNKKFRVIAFNKQKEIIKNLTNSYCHVKSRLINFEQIESLITFEENLTNTKLVVFSNDSQDYNLDNLSLYFDNQLPEQIFYQIEINCSSIKVPVYNSNQTFKNIISHNNYKLRLNVKPLPCQYGEILNLKDNSCQLCDSDLGFFSISLNKSRCLLKDDYSMIKVTPAQLNLRPFFWRPYFESSQIGYCNNLPENCIGGWNYGNEICYRGHIGALCEVCDIQNLRGEGQYSQSEQYSCWSCTSISKNIILLVVASCWTLCTIFISVQDSIIYLKQQIKASSLNFLKSKYFISENSYSSKLLKIFINYFQIISSVVKQLQIPIGLALSINTLGTPIQASAYSLDCFLINDISLDIQYSRVIWHLCAPIFYVSAVQLLFAVFVKFKISINNRGVISTSIIYIYIYLQPSLIGSLSELLSFREISGFRWISANVSYLFDTTKHITWMKCFVLPCIIFLGIIIPLFLLYQLIINRNSLQSKQTQQTFGFLYLEYKPSCYFWEITKIIQKELMIICLTFYDQNPILKFLILALIQLVYILLNQMYLPYHYSNFNLLDYHSSLTCIISMVLVFGLYSAKEYNLQEIVIINFIVIFLVNLYLIYQLILLIIKLKLRETIDKILEKLILLQYKYTILQKILFHTKLKKIQQNRIQIRKRFHMIKEYLIKQASQIIKLKQYNTEFQFNMFQNSNLLQLNLQKYPKNKKCVLKASQFNFIQDAYQFQLKNAIS